MKIYLLRIFIESILIVISVFIAIFLEDLWQQRNSRIQAEILLGQLKNELSEDLKDLEIIIQNQKLNSQYYLLLLNKLEALDSKSFYIVDSVLQKVGAENRTLYPRSSSWSILISSGLLPEIRDTRLSVQLMSLFENKNKRLVDNGDGYDRTLNEMLRVHIPEFWDFAKKEPTSNNLRAVSKFRIQVLHVYRDWNLYYVKLLEEHKLTVESLVNLIESSS